MSKGRKVRIQVKTVRGTYVGTVIIPAIRNRVSDVLNDDGVQFVNLTDVVINDVEHADFVSLNKDLIESVRELDLA